MFSRSSLPLLFIKNFKKWYIQCCNPSPEKQRMAKIARKLPSKQNRELSGRQKKKICKGFKIF